MARKEKLRVYLDHLIQRDNFLYRQVQHEAEEPAQQRNHLAITSLYGEDTVEILLRKPDFQRATWAWTPDDCVGLIESVLAEQVVPSVIMWLSPDNLQYVLDGGHRISVLLAWIHDNWGDKLGADRFADDDLYRQTRIAAKRVRDLLSERGIASFRDYLDANKKYDEIIRLKRSPREWLTPQEQERAKQVRRWKGVDVGFPILWVKGDHVTAEKSFLKINKTGRRLSDWETKFVENRSSAFARTIMSVASPYQAERCWPTSADPEAAPDPSMKEDALAIVQKAEVLHDLLFKPAYRTPIKDPRLPLMGAPASVPEFKPGWVSELLTITEGTHGSRAQTERLLRRGVTDPPDRIVQSGRRIIENAIDAVSHITGSSPRSLGLMPLVYFYNPQGVYVRSLLYGMLYWLNSGDQDEILQRKLAFSLFRSPFEQILLESKGRIVSRTTRRIGSGTDVMLHTARYFDGLLQLLITHAGDISSDEMKGAHDYLVETLGKDSRDKKTRSAGVQRTFRGPVRASVEVRDFLASLQRCQICGGRFFPGHFTQIDHIHTYASGGATEPDNGRSTHPFCNNNRKRITQLQAAQHKLNMPAFADGQPQERSQQLSFLAF